eukprot:1847063-Rhodomonas_salina.1
MSSAVYGILSAVCAGSAPIYNSTAAVYAGNAAIYGGTAHTCAERVRGLCIESLWHKQVERLQRTVKGTRQTSAGAGGSKEKKERREGGREGGRGRDREELAGEVLRYAEDNRKLRYYIVMPLRAPYAKTGTDIVYAATLLVPDAWY